MLACLCVTACFDDDDDFLKIPEFSKSEYATVCWNPQRLCVAGTKLYVCGYGDTFSGDHAGGYYYPLQNIDPTTFSTTAIGKATHMASYGTTLFTALCTSADYVSYTTAFNHYTADGMELGDFLKNAPAELYNSILYMLDINPYNGDIYIGTTDCTTDYCNDSKVYHFDASGHFIGMITGVGPSVNKAVFVDDDVYFLTEGLWKNNNSNVYRVAGGEEQATEFYSAANGGQLLGDTGQDLIAVDGVFYVVVFGSKYVARLDRNGKETARYAFTDTDGAPRYACAYGDYVYVTTYGNKVIKFTRDLTPVAEHAVGMNPEQIVVYYGRLCVACCGWGDDNRVFVIHPDNF